MTRTDAVAAYLRARPHQWVSAYELERIGGRFAWRTRCSEAARWYGMDIESKVVTHANGVKEPFRRYVPKAEPTQAALWEVA